MKIGVIADDFTGASDIALTLAESGMAVAQFTGVPDARAAKQLDAGVVALKSRTCPVNQAVSQSLAACEWLLEQSVEQIVFKVCSTFDSTPEGNIGPVLDALAERLDAGPVVVCPAFPENGRSVYQGHLFVGDALLNESGMETHPLTPMTDADLRRVLSAQSKQPVGHVPITTVTQGRKAIQDCLPPKGHVIVDAIHNADLMTIGATAHGAKLLCGGSGIALGLPANFGNKPGRPEWAPVNGPGVVLSGSCSSMTRRQIDVFSRSNPAVEVTADAIIKKITKVEVLANWILAQERVPLIFSSADPKAVAESQEKYGREASAQAIETFFSSLANLLLKRGVTRFVVAGGETSGAVVRGMGAKVLNIGPRVAPGVPLVRIHQRNVALALKSGNFGDEMFFKTALDQMESA